MTDSDLDALRTFRDKVLMTFNAGRKFVGWYYREGKKGAAWLNQNPGWKPVVRLALIIPVSISKITAASKWYQKTFAFLLVLGCFGFVFAWHDYERRRRSEGSRDEVPGR